MRAGIGLTRLLADHVDIGRFVPDAEIASTGFALASPDALLVYVPDGAYFTLDLHNADAVYRTEWFDVQTGRVISGLSMRGGKVIPLQAPTGGGSVLFLRSDSASVGALLSVEARAREVWRNAIQYSPWPVRLRFAVLGVLRPLTQDRTRAVLSLLAFFVSGAIAGAAIAWGLLWRARSRGDEAPAA